MWLVDSSKFIDWMRTGRNPTRILRHFVLGGQAATCGIVRIEVLRGAVKPAVRDELSALFDGMTDIPITSAVCKRASELAWNLDRQGMMLPVSDLVIAACALHVGARVVTTDPHFSRFPGLERLP